MSRRASFLVILVLALITAGCGGGDSDDSGATGPADAGAATLDDGPGEGDAPDSTPEDGASTGESQTDPESGDNILTISGDPFAIQMMETLVRAGFESANPGYRLKLLKGADASPGVQGVLDGTLDLLVVFREPEEDEAVAYQPMVRTEVSIQLNPSNPVRNLTSEEAVAIFTGEVTNWSELGGEDETILVLVFPEDDPLTELMRAELLGDAPFAETAQVAGNLAGMDDVLAAIPGAVTYGMNATHMLSGGSIRKREFRAVTLDGMDPDDADYPLILIASLMYLPEREQEFQPYFDWLAHFSREGAGAILAPMFGMQIVIGQPEVTEEASPGGD